MGHGFLQYTANLQRGRRQVCPSVHCCTVAGAIGSGLLQDTATLAGVQRAVVPFTILPLGGEAVSVDILLLRQPGHAPMQAQAMR